MIVTPSCRSRGKDSRTQRHILYKRIFESSRLQRIVDHPETVLQFHVHPAGQHNRGAKLDAVCGIRIDSELPLVQTEPTGVGRKRHNAKGLLINEIRPCIISVLRKTGSHEMGKAKIANSGECLRQLREVSLTSYTEYARVGPDESAEVKLVLYGIVHHL
ncbi:hypothetical protein BKA93DRAFT_880361 [Sparassis latifolia]